jgi:hypothetical protein
VTNWLQALLLEKAAGAVRRTWLVVLPASGTVLRAEGALLFVDVGGDAGWSPFVVGGNVALAIDPRALILDDATLAVAYHPRDHLHEVNAAAGEWYALNPNVFCRETKSGITPIRP